ncbi:CheR family methyltransferase [Candidatus Symbiobacter mobilis]|uniref:Chemotaxis methyltransferase CheR n=1 Tax=Candidatus Symbiobacter mobilis CR TaxID=946483 RepID=U5N778_9BURK|nr:protein-glutamate O-methyltransferase CheR [Candidatus Symbiobacter mobilis]AGX87356.1 chemotaxis methyltransferase CheR [Candidatus Symbiobacter mobilis CR]
MDNSHDSHDRPDGSNDPAPPGEEGEVERLEIELLFEAILRRYGRDFRNYAYDSARRRVLHRLQIERLPSLGAMQHSALHDRRLADRLMSDMSINVTEMFRDPVFFHTLREDVLPVLREEDHIKIWHAGCASGEEVYSMAILLMEAGLYERAKLYATDFNPAILEQARNGIFPLESMRRNVQNYQAAGGERDFSDYYHARYGGAAMEAHLKRNLVFSHHDLARDEPFGEMQAIICRNVLIYFNQSLKNRALQLFLDSLAPSGFLCLGSHEGLYFSALAQHFTIVSAEHRIYRKRPA